ncbi:hypothetical protein B0T20DRAFT_484784 [Sordaria brevicollis]|uniref:Uncharacterized protein n=1 Tax=Sordaria brevicollis TaxID=83679 RepID=A0AAE0U0Q1_SORBR|nr:hypothetical protein B0T20DRAFT_484784 [Sordaria brevicollis]
MAGGQAERKREWEYFSCRVPLPKIWFSSVFETVQQYLECQRQERQYKRRKAYMLFRSSHSTRTAIKTSSSTSGNRTTSLLTSGNLANIKARNDDCTDSSTTSSTTNINTNTYTNSNINDGSFTSSAKTTINGLSATTIDGSSHTGNASTENNTTSRIGKRVRFVEDSSTSKESRVGETLEHTNAGSNRTGSNRTGSNRTGSNRTGSNTIGGTTTRRASMDSMKSMERIESIESREYKEHRLPL